MPEIVVRRFEDPDEDRSFELGSFELVNLGGITIGRARYEPGWKWSEHVAPIAGTPTCEVEHVGMVVSGRAAIAMNGGETREVGPGDIFFVPPGHDSWVVGEDPYVSLHFLGADTYASE
jgi:quercetin dioxygenase-like cupin family protein